MSQFVKEVTKYEVVPVIDGYGPGGAIVSIGRVLVGEFVDITIGAPHRSSSCNSFNKETLGEMIDILIKVQQAMDN